MRELRILLYYLSVLGFGLAVFALLFIKSNGTEELLLGAWQEEKWEYEKLQSSSSKLESAAMLPEYTKNKVKENLVIHEAEKWTFYEDQRLVLESDDFQKEVNWIVKGRGNILVLRYGDDFQEQYTIDRLTQHSLEVSFYTESNVRAIAKLTFSKKRK